MIANRTQQFFTIRYNHFQISCVQLRLSRRTSCVIKGAAGQTHSGPGEPQRRLHWVG